MLIRRLLTPYWKWGNTPNDFFGSKTQGIEATPLLRRVHPYIQDAVDNHNRLLLEDKNYAASWYWRSRNYMYY